MPVFDPFDAQTLDVAISELLVATADGCDAELDHKVTTVLRELRRQLQMDVVFVSEFVGGERVFRFVDAASAAPVQAGDAGPLEQSYCQRVVQGRMPELVPDAAVLVRRGELPATDIPVGAHLSTPVVLPDGRVYGTVCCFSAAAKASLRDADLTRLRQCASLVARMVDVPKRMEFAPTEPDWSLAPIEDRTWPMR